jgi:hypothetical protein
MWSSGCTDPSVDKTLEMEETARSEEALFSVLPVDFKLQLFNP